MEYPTKNDFYLKFKAITSSNNKFLDYILIEVSNNFFGAVNVKPELIIGMKFSNLVFDKDNNILDFHELQYHMIPNSRRKFEKYVSELRRWYLVNIFGDSGSEMILFYSDITKLKNGQIPTQGDDTTKEELIAKSV
ncbi:MAG: hypothetical protein KMY55_14010 [Dethiosulfatibacter sp.]|nr:hypothetical protein [Dethiosulfatibacter sp.]